MAKYLVTGGAGFIGSNLVDALIWDSHDVTVWDNFATGKPENVNKDARLVDADINHVQPRRHEKKCFDAIFHLAALAGIQPSFEKPGLTIDANVLGTMTMLEIARRQGIPLIYAGGSSSFYYDVYASPYTFSKWQGEEMCRMYSKVYGVRTAIARFFGVYGPRQVSEGTCATVIGVFERQKKAGEAFTITGNGSKRRDFTHVMDIVDGLQRLLEGFWFGDSFNFGTGINYSIKEVADMFKPVAIEYLPERRGEAQATLADISEAKDKLGWSPKVVLSEYIKEFLTSYP